MAKAKRKEKAKKNVYEIQKDLAERASNDQKFRKDLLEHPRETLQKEAGFELPGNIRVIVHENTLDTIHLIVPVGNWQISDRQLEGISGGMTNLLAIRKVRIAKGERAGQHSPVGSGLSTGQQSDSSQSPGSSAGQSSGSTDQVSGSWGRRK